VTRDFTSSWAAAVPKRDARERQATLGSAAPAIAPEDIRVEAMKSEQAKM
jgi:hypothetical protein